MGIIVFIVVLSVLAIVHEAGHFRAARIFGVAVDEFGLGFPPRIYAWKKGETEYSLNWLPIGGFVRIHGEQEDANTDRKSFANIRAWKKVVVLLAGVVMNLILAWVLMTLVFGIGTRTAVENGERYKDAIVKDIKTQVYTSAGGAAEKAGVNNGDQLISIDGKDITNTEDLINYLKEKKYPTISLKVVVNGNEETIKVTPEKSDGTYRYGLGVERTAVMRYAWIQAPGQAVIEVGRLIRDNFVGVGQLLAGAFRGQLSEDVSGPIGLAVVTNEVAKYGLVTIMQFTAILSVWFAVLNILPLPALDGGRVAILLISRAIRRRIAANVENMIHTVGFMVLIALAIYLSMRDVSKYNLISQIVGWFN